MSKNAEFELFLLGCTWMVKRSLPPKIDSKERLANDVEDPLSIMYGLSDKNNSHFIFAKKRIDNPKILLNGRLTNAEFKKQSSEAYPNLKVREALDSYSMDLFRCRHSQLVEKMSKRLIERFETNFFKINSKFFEIHRPSAFLRSPMTCTPEVIKEFEELAAQGHVFSQFMAGLLHTTMAGGYDSKGVSYLIMAYENRFPRSMDALAEYLLHKEDYLGSVQCSLLSIDSMDDSKGTMNRILQHMHGLFVETPSIVWMHTFIFKHELNGKLLELAKKHFPEFYPSKEEEQQQAVKMLLSRGES